MAKIGTPIHYGVYDNQEDIFTFMRMINFRVALINSVRSIKYTSRKRVWSASEKQLRAWAGKELAGVVEEFVYRLPHKPIRNLVRKILLRYLIYKVGKIK